MQTRSFALSRKGKTLDHRTHAVIGRLLESIGSTRALTVWLLYKYDEHKQLVTLTCNPLEYRDPIDFRNSYAATKLLQKCADLNTGIDTKAVAIEAAAEAESRCRVTNSRLRSWAVRSDDAGEVPHGVKLLDRARFIIERILGRRPETLFEFEDQGWSPGRTTSCSGNEISPVHKYTGRLDVTSCAYGMARNLLNASPTWASAALAADGPCSLLYGAFNFVRGASMTVVPKNAKTDRTICYEPHLNVRLQLMVGDYIRKRLAVVGVDLNDQSVNQRRARVASLRGHLATLDLSAASDTICLELVRWLLPPDWFFILDRLRSKETRWPGEQTYRRNEKFSSMGNGFTFELESLIFYALAMSVCGDGVTVYGDDIIIPTEKFSEVAYVLEFSGFVLNEAKSFSDGPFRESCGFDAFAGLDCTPLYVRTLPKAGRPIDEWSYKIHNGFRRWASVLPHTRYSLDLRYIRSIIPGHLGPSGKGDGHYHVNVEEATPLRHRTWDGWFYTTSLRIYRVNTTYGDRIVGNFSGAFGHAALCAATGPRRLSDAVASSARRDTYIVKDRRLFSHSWENIVWI